MGKFKDWIAEEVMSAPRKPGEIAGPRPHQTDAKVTQATNTFVAKNPNFATKVTTAPTPKQQVNVINTGVSDILSQQNLANSHVTPDVLSQRLATSVGVDPKQLQRNMGMNT